MAADSQTDLAITHAAIPQRRNLSVHGVRPSGSPMRYDFSAKHWWRSGWRRHWISHFRPLFRRQVGYDLAHAIADC